VRQFSPTATGNGNPRDAQMILFPLMTTWMWFQIFTASPPLTSGRRSLLPVPPKEG
jgi:hypothetical protein